MDEAMANELIAKVHSMATKLDYMEKRQEWSSCPDAKLARELTELRAYHGYNRERAIHEERIHYVQLKSWMETKQLEPEVKAVLMKFEENSWLLFMSFDTVRYAESVQKSYEYYINYSKDEQKKKDGAEKLLKVHLIVVQLVV